jgi:hypothetical protein
MRMNAPSSLALIIYCPCTDTREAVELALDLVTFRHEVERGLESLGALDFEQRD